MAGRHVDASSPARRLSETSVEVSAYRTVIEAVTNAEIGERLHLSAKTIANNVSTILTTLQVTQRGQAIVRAREAGLGQDRHVWPHMSHRRARMSDDSSCCSVATRPTSGTTGTSGRSRSLMACMASTSGSPVRKD